MYSAVEVVENRLTVFVKVIIFGSDLEQPFAQGQNQK